ncbi:MAG: cysteine--tRNA ligase [Candidatus Cloacimonadales bacterium]|nr:cysteine--tRNA ligase [Candidatus Cloacimonadota bacterium]MDD2649877.1 cysteine--tRNA ligase [Candidatus Cloacimonadota bacterium]MDX9976920.1 cysteine--tRNA ligase [Candidatus Cloacimonadales bacterium]
MKIYNTMTRKKDDFIPITEGEINMYACGPTVYNYFHIGNARPFLFFDVVRRYFKYLGYKVSYVQNITDIDDKIIEQAIKEKTNFNEIAERYTKAFFDDLKLLNINYADFNPKATEYISEMIDLINTLVVKGNAYESNGDVYFSVESIPNYGKLSGKNLNELQAGARIEANTQKKNPADFTLWKKAKDGEPSWDSPWGAGRPGWHTECVVMSRKILGQTFDIHGGGVDLIFPHHENELAQAYALDGEPLANYWMHNGFLNVDGNKMSKSLNNFFTTRDIMKDYDPEVIRFFFLSKHYRSPIDFNEEIIIESKKALANFYSAFSSIDIINILDQDIDIYEFNEAVQAFKEAMNDDFNTAKALAVMFDLVKEIKSKQNSLKKQQAAALTLYELGQVLGFFVDLEDRLTNSVDQHAEKLIELMINYRLEAKQEKNYAFSDRIRHDLSEIGIELQDTPQGTIWKIKE